MNVAGMIEGAAAMAAFVGATTSPVLKWHDKRKEKKQSEEELDVALKGEPAIPGVRNAVLGLPVRVMALEGLAASLNTTVSQVVAGQSMLEQRMDEANGTGSRTEQKVDALSDLVKRGLVPPS
jgi:hypothetical protein